MKVRRFYKDKAPVRHLIQNIVFREIFQATLKLNCQKRTQSYRNSQNIELIIKIKVGNSFVVAAFLLCLNKTYICLFQCHRVCGGDRVVTG